MDIHRAVYHIHPVLCAAVALFCVVCFYVTSAGLVRTSRSARVQYARNTTLPRFVLGRLIHSVVISYLVSYIVFSGFRRFVALSKSSLGFLVAEVSLAYLTTELIISLVAFPRSLLQDKLVYLDRLLGALNSLIAVWIQGGTLVLCVFRLLSHFSSIFLTFELILLECGLKKSQFFLYNFVLLIVTSFICQISIIPWFWKFFIVFVTSSDVPSLSVVLSLVIVSIATDALNIYRFISVLRQFILHVQEMGIVKSHANIII